MNKLPKTPAGLSKKSAGLWRVVNERYVLDPGQLELLESGLRALDRAEQCRRVIEGAGPTVENRFGELRPHPLLATERDSRGQFLQTCKALDLHLPGGQS